MKYLNDKIRKEVAELHYNSGAFKANTEEPFHVNKNRSPIYVRSQDFLGKVTLREELMNHLEKTAKEIYFDIIAGIETGGIPFSSILADRLGRPAIYIRKKKIEYAPQIEGKDKEELKNKKILLFEDTIYSGKTIKNSITLLKDLGAVVEDCVVFFNRQQHEKDLLDGINLHDLTNTTMMLEYLMDLGVTVVNNISTNEIKLYLQDSEEWHKKRGFPFYKE